MYFLNQNNLIKEKLKEIEQRMRGAMSNEELKKLDITINNLEKKFDRTKAVHEYVLINRQYISSDVELFFLYQEYINKYNELI